jgi:adenylate kinase
MTSEPITLLFFGRSGCGKGTQADLIIKHLESISPLEHLYLETGKELRSFTEETNDTAHLTKEVMETGDFLPAFLPIWIWTDTLVRKLTSSKHLILDGLSRRIHEAPILDSALTFYKRKNPIIIYLDVSVAWSRQRMLERGRSDDEVDAIAHRLHAFDTDTMPVLEYFRTNKNYTFITVNGEQAIDAVHSDIMKNLGI